MTMQLAFELRVHNLGSITTTRLNAFAGWLTSSVVKIG